MSTFLGLPVYRRLKELGLKKQPTGCVVVDDEEERRRYKLCRDASGRLCYLMICSVPGCPRALQRSTVCPDHSSRMIEFRGALSLCDGKTCGTGTRFRSNNIWVCDHNSLAAVRPDLAEEWDTSINHLSPHEVYCMSTMKVGWICKRATCSCHRYEMMVASRVEAGSSCTFCSRKQVCIHDSIVTTHPHLLDEWDYEKNIIDPATVSMGCAKLVFWRCKNDPCGCHSIKLTVNTKVSKPRKFSCGYCSRHRICIHNSIVSTHPHLLSEWDYEQNKVDPGTVASGSHDLYYWICSKGSCECHRYRASPDKRTAKNGATGCPYCLNQKVCVHASIAGTHPHLLAEWDYERNTISPESITFGSGVKVFWKCPTAKCSCHSYAVAPNSKIKGISASAKCGYCSKIYTCIHDSIVTTHPHLLDEWDYERNEVDPSTVGHYSGVKRYWICRKSTCPCTHRWTASTSSRTSFGRGCPYCRPGRLPCPHYNFAVLHPGPAAEWHSDNEYDPTEYTPRSNCVVRWLCSKCSRPWDTSISNRAAGTNCPVCVQVGYSKKQIEWLTSIEGQCGLYIQHAIKADGEHFIPTVGKVDGFHQPSNSVWEFHGSYYHGHPSKFESEAINPSNGKTYGRLFANTVERDNRILSLGYRLVVRWEQESEDRVYEPYSRVDYDKVPT